MNNESSLALLVTGIFSSGIYFFGFIISFFLKEILRKSFIPFTVLMFIFSWYYFWISIINYNILPYGSIFFGMNLIFTGYGGCLIYLFIKTIIHENFHLEKRHYLFLLTGIPGTLVYILMHSNAEYFATAYTYYTQTTAHYDNLFGLLYLFHTAILAFFLIVSLVILLKKITKRNLSFKEKKPAIILLIALTSIIITYVCSNIIIYFFRIMEVKFIAPLASLPLVTIFLYTANLNRKQLQKAQRIKNENQRLNKDLLLAQQIQQSIIPQKTPGTKGLATHYIYLPMDKVGGDFYDFLELSDHELGVFIGDVSGHGVPAAFAASMIKVAISVNNKQATEPEIFLKSIASNLQSILKYQFITAMYLYFNMKKKTVTIANAGHLPVIIHNTKTGDTQEVHPQGLCIGLEIKLLINTKTVPLLSGDRILLYTDGLIECTNDRDELFESERLKETLIESGNKTLEETSREIMQRVTQWNCGKNNFSDDITCVLVDVF